MQFSFSQKAAIKALCKAMVPKEALPEEQPRQLPRVLEGFNSLLLLAGSLPKYERCWPVHREAHDMVASFSRSE